MKRYQYQIVRYIHDRITGEFVNIGIILYHPETMFLQAQFVSKYNRISHFFSEVNGQALLNALKQFEREIHRTANTFVEIFTPPTNLEEITKFILPKDDSALICTPVSIGLDINMEAALNYLYKSIVGKYIQDETTTLPTNEDVWRKVYKKYFDEKELTKKLAPHSVKTENDNFVFERAWKNGVWNCYEPLTFDLQKSDNIKNKVYKWSGILSELETTDEEINLNLLVVNSTKYRDINKFIVETLERKSDKLKVSIITEDKARELTSQMQKSTSK